MESEEKIKQLIQYREGQIRYLALMKVSASLLRDMEGLDFDSIADANIDLADRLLLKLDERGRI